MQAVRGPASDPVPMHPIPLRSAFLALAAALALSVAGPAWSAPAPDVRAAQLAAYRALADRVLALEVGDDTRVRGLVGGSDRVAAGLNDFVKRARLGTPFPHGDGLAMEAAVSRTALAGKLLDLGATDPDRAAWLCGGGPERIVAVGVATLERRHAPAVGMPPVPPAAAPTPVPAAATPAPTPPAVRPAPGAFRRYADDPALPAINPDPAGSVRNRVRARRAAEVDALRRLAQQTGSVHVDTRNSTQRGALTTDTTHVHVSATLPGVRFGPARDGGDGTVTVDAAATLEGASAPVTATGTGLVPSEARP